MKNSKFRMFFGMLFITVILSSCLSMAGRLFTVREQMCEFDDHFNIQIDQAVKITLLEPVLLEIDQDMLGLLPERQVLVSWLGSPIEPGDSIGDLSYEFQLKGEQAGSGISRVDMDYDHEGQRPLTIEASFTRYSASIDVPEGTLRMKLY